MKYRGYVVLALTLVGAFYTMQPAFLEVALLLVIISMGKDGEFLVGDLAKQIGRISAMQSAAVKALLMSMPVKTLTAMLGTSTPQALSEVALSATVALVGLGLALGLFATGLAMAPESIKKTAVKPRPWVAVLDFALIAFLLLIGDDGPKLFGSLAERFQEAAPLLRETWVRGAIAILPVKTVTTLLFAESGERRRISAHGSITMGVLATMTFVAFWTSSYESVLLALVAGILAASFSFVSLDTFRRVVREEARAAI